MNSHSIFKLADVVPSHIGWSFGSHAYVNPAEVSTWDFQYQIQVARNVDSPSSFRESVRNACQRLDRVRQGKTVALCYTGGLDSEVIALTLEEYGIPFELYFLDIWGINPTKFRRNVHIVHLKRDFFLEVHAPENFQRFGVEFPTYLALTYLFEMIPQDQFIVVGDGDFDRSGRIFKEDNLNSRNEPASLKITSAGVLYYLWSIETRRLGEFYFYSSTPELIQAVLGHPLYIGGESGFRRSTRELIYREFPEIQFIEKSTNWDGGGYHENIFIRNWLGRQANIFRGFENWRPGVKSHVVIGKQALPRITETPARIRRQLESSTLCSLPWNHIVVGSFDLSPCCNFSGKGFSKNVNTVQAFTDSTQMKNLRMEMVAGKKPKDCSACYQTEKHLGSSMRTAANEKYPRAWLNPPKLRSLEFNLGNVCNLKCRGCSSVHSSRWYRDEVALGDDERGFNGVLRPNLDQLNKLLPNIETLKLLGGEPFLTPEHNEILYSIRDQNIVHQLKIEYATNGTVRVSDEILEIWRNLKGLRLFFSIDGLGKNNDFFRTGSEWQRIIENINWYRKELAQCKVEFGIHTVVNIYNVREIVELDVFLAQEFSEFILSKDLIRNPAWLDIRNLPKLEKSRLRNYYGLVLEKKSASSHCLGQYKKILEYLEQQPSLHFSAFIDRHNALNRINQTSYIPCELGDLFPQSSSVEMEAIPTSF
jgi:organic radical activating enzyme